MTDSATGRMLLSHNFTLLDSDIHPLNREEFAQVFANGLAEVEGVSAEHIDNPHWVVDVRFDSGKYTPTEVGEHCAQVLAKYRQDQKSESFIVLALGGVKTTPATSPTPSLQPGEWGVDVVETREPETFLAEINWDTLSGAKPQDQIFRIDHKV